MRLPTSRLVLTGAVLGALSATSVAAVSLSAAPAPAGVSVPTFAPSTPDPGLPTMAALAQTPVDVPVTGEQIAALATTAPKRSAEVVAKAQRAAPVSTPVAQPLPAPTRATTSTATATTAAQAKPTTQRPDRDQDRDERELRSRIRAACDDRSLTGEICSEAG